MIPLLGRGHQLLMRLDRCKGCQLLLGFRALLERQLGVALLIIKVGVLVNKDEHDDQQILQTFELLFYEELSLPTSLYQL